MESHPFEITPVYNMHAHPPENFDLGKLSVEYTKSLDKDPESSYFHLMSCEDFGNRLFVRLQNHFKASRVPSMTSSNTMFVQ